MSDRTDRDADDGRQATPEEDTHLHDIAAREEALEAEILGIDPDDEPEPSAEDDDQEEHDPDTDHPETEDEPGDDTANADDDAEAASEDRETDDGDQDAEPDQAEDTGADEKIPDNWHPSAKKRLRRALKDRRRFKDQLAEYEQSHQAMQGLHQICEKHKLPQEQAPALLGLVGKALIGRDEASQRALFNGLQQAGLKLPEPEQRPPEPPPIALDDLAAAIEKAEDNFDFDTLKQMVAKAKERASQPPPAPSQTPTQEAPEQKLPQSVEHENQQHFQEQASARILEEKAQLMDQMLESTFGPEEGLKVGQQIYNQAKRRMEGKPVQLWGDVLQMTMEQVLSQKRQPTPKPPQTVRSSGNRPKPKSSIDRRMEALEKDLTGG